MKKQPKIIEYTNILHAHGLGSKQSSQFKQTHKDDEELQRRAKTLDEVWVVLHKNNDPVPNTPLVMGVICLILGLGVVFLVLLL